MGWLIFMISGSNEQLQQQLEYTQLKPDCHSWWISKMKSGREDTLEERYAIKLCFKLGNKMPQKPTECFRLLLDHLAWIEHQMGIKTVPQPPYSPDLAPCDFWLFPKLRECRYETIEEMKEAVTKVTDTLTQEDFYGAFQKFLERYNKCIAAGGDYFEGD